MVGQGTIGLTTSRTTVLRELRQRGPTKQNVLAEALKVSPRTMTGLIDGLVATGFVTREPHPTDRRASLVTFTEHGTATIEAMERDQQQLVGILFGGMSAKQFDCFLGGLEQILERLREHGLSYGWRFTSEGVFSRPAGGRVRVGHVAKPVVLREPTVIALPQTDGEPVTEVRLYVDDPDALVRRAKQHLDTSTRANI